MRDGTDKMPYKTEYGSHYHMTYGCHGATIACDAAGLSPCSDCCGSGGGGAGNTQTGDDTGFAEGTASGVMADSSSDGLPVESYGGDDAGGASDSRDGSVVGVIGRLRAWASRHANPVGSRHLPPSQRMTDLRERWDGIEQACDEAMREVAAQRFSQRPSPAEAKELSTHLMRPRTGDVVDIGFSRKLAESATIIVQWADNSRPLPHRPMGCQVDIRDVSDDGMHPTRSATVTAYSLLEAPPDMRRRGFPGIACRTEFLCGKGRIRDIRYRGIESPIWAYGETESHVSLVPLSEEEWRRATAICDSYGHDGGDATDGRIGDDVGELAGRGELLGRKVSGTAGYDEANGMFRQACESREGRTVELDSFEVVSSQWNLECDRMSRWR